MWCAATDCSCGAFSCEGGKLALPSCDRRCRVECLVQKVVLQWRERNTQVPMLGRLVGERHSIYVEIAPVGAECQRKRTCAGRQSNEWNVLASGTDEVCVWDTGTKGKDEGTSNAKSFESCNPLIFEYALTITEFEIIVLVSRHGWLPGQTGVEATPEPWAEARFNVNEDVVSRKGVRGELTLPLVFHGRVRGSISLVVSVCSAEFGSPIMWMPPLGICASELRRDMMQEEVLPTDGFLMPRVQLVKVVSHPAVAHPVQLSGHESTVACCAAFPSGGRVLTGSHDRTGVIWSDQGEQLAVLRGHSGPVTDCAVFPSEDQVVTVSKNEARGIIWSLMGDQCTVLHGAQSCVVFPSGDSVLTAWSRDKTSQGAAIFSKAGELLITHLGHASAVTACAVFPAGERALVAASDGEAVVLSSSGRTLKLLRGHTDSVTACIVLPCGRKALTASRDTTGIIWQTDACGKPEKHTVVLHGHARCVTACAVLQDGNAVATASEDKRAIIWSLAGEQLGEFTGHNAPIIVCSIVQSGESTVLTASSDGAVVLWRPYWTVSPGSGQCTTRQCAELRGHTGVVGAAAVLPSGDRVLTVSEDRTGMIWPVAPLLTDFAGRRVQSLPIV